MEEDKLGGKERWQQMITVILVSHGGMAKGMVESTTMLIGEQPDLAFITFEPEDGVEDLTAKVEERSFGRRRGYCYDGHTERHAV